ncbi:MAG: DUF3037 domain-containing protein [Capnocytophaga sp.]|nr:DUF3037 domain-containing protein [Capnocytophaga sp.]
MQESKLYEYAVIRLVPDIEREEFFNVGLIMFSKKNNYLRASYHIDLDLFALLGMKLEYDEVDRSLDTFCKIAEGKLPASTVSRYAVPERFRWLTAVRSAIVQTSRPHPGKCDDLELTFEKLFQRNVLRNEV